MGFDPKTAKKFNPGSARKLNEASASSTGVSGTSPTAPSFDQATIDSLLRAEDVGAIDPETARGLSAYRDSGEFPKPLSGGGLGRRTQFSFLSSPTQKLNFLKSRYGDARIHNGEFQYKDPKTGQFKPFDEEGLSLADIGDFAGDIPGVAGSLLGAAGGGAVGGGVGATAGSGLGFATGELARTGIGELIEPDPSLSGNQIARDFQRNLAIGAASEAVPRAGIAAINKARSPFAGQVDREILDISKQYDIPLTPSEVLKESSTPAFLLKGGEDVLQSTITGAGPFKTLKAGRYDKLMGVADDIVTRAGDKVDPSQLKVSVSEAVEASRGTFMAEAEALYKPLKKATEGVSVDVSSVKGFAQKVLAEIPEQERIVAGGAGAEASQLVAQLERISALPDNLPFAHAQFYRSQLLAMIRADKSVIAGRAKGTAKKMVDVLENRLRKHAKDAGVLDDYVAANEFYASGIARFENQFIKSLARTDPEKIIRSTYSSIDDLRKLKSVVDKPTFRKVQRAKIEEIIESGKTSDTATGDPFFLGKRALDNWKRLTPEIRREGFEPEVARELDRFLNFASKAQTKERGIGLWGMSQGVRGAEVLATGGAFALGGAGAAAGVFLTPYVLSKLIVSKVGRRILTEGYRVKPGTRDAIRITGRLALFLEQEQGGEATPEQRRNVLGDE